jgi:hypothetical protein
MKRIIKLTESDLTRIVRRVLKEENETQPAITSISVLQNMLTPSGMDGVLVSVTGSLGVVNCDPTPNTKGKYTVNGRSYDMDLIKQALGTDTKIVVSSFSPGDTGLNRVYEELQTEGLTFNFEFPKSKITNLSDDTLFAVMVEKGGNRLQYDGKNVATKCKGFMLT